MHVDQYSLLFRLGISVLLVATFTGVSYAQTSNEDLGRQKIGELKTEERHVATGHIFREIYKFLGADHLKIADELTKTGFTCRKAKSATVNKQPEIECSIVWCKNPFRLGWKHTSVHILNPNGSYIKNSFRDENVGNNEVYVSGGTLNYFGFCPGRKKRRGLEGASISVDDPIWEVHSLTKSK